MVRATVYTDGIYDLTHVGHFRSFELARSFGDRLIVGVCGDESATAYKRRPIMTLEERAQSVLGSPAVDEVILDAPCTRGGLDEAFLRKHSIDAVVCCEEYASASDEWYAVPRRLGMLRTIPRTSSVSTSELIRRVLERQG